LRFSTSDLSVFYQLPGDVATGKMQTDARRNALADDLGRGGRPERILKTLGVFGA